MDGENDLTLKEMTRIIIGLRSAGWNEKNINDFILFVCTGDEAYIPENQCI